MRLLHKIKKYISSNPSFRRGKSLVVGVSGGPDSVALLHILHKLQYELGYNLHVAHYNHHWRRGSNTDQKFVERLAQELNIPCTVGHWKNPKSSTKGSKEELARNRRLAFFKRVVKNTKAAAVVLAHTQDDHAETVLMRLLRGSGMQGLRGILEERTIDGLQIIRPLIDVSKEDLLHYLTKNKIPYRTDPTNNQADFFRNKVRLQLMPLLTQQYNPNIKDMLTNLADHAATDYAYIEQQSLKAFMRTAKSSPKSKSVTIDLKAYCKQHPSLRRMIIRNSIRQIKGNMKRITLNHLKSIDELITHQPQNSTVHLPQNIRIRKNATHLTLSRN